MFWGMVSSNMPVHPSNAYSLIAVIELGIIVFFPPNIIEFLAVSITALQLSRESYLLFPLETTISFKFVHPENIDFVIEVTESPIEIDDNALQPLKDALPIAFTEFGITISSKLQQSENA